MFTIKIIITGAISYKKEHISKIIELGYEIIYVKDERKKLNIDVSNVEGVICNNLFQYNSIEKFTKLKFIQTTSAGVNRLPIDYINKQKIDLYNAENVYSVPMSEWVILKILEIYKKSTYYYDNQRKKHWKKNRELFELTNKKVGIIGFGNVGKEISKRLQPFGVDITAINRSIINSKYIDRYVQLDNLLKVLPELDIIIITIALTEETKKLISKNEISLMKDKSILINVARGAIINEQDLINSLEKKKFLGVALDVFENEPLSNSPLWNFENVIISPHISYGSINNEDRLFNIIYENLNKINNR